MNRFRFSAAVTAIIVASTLTGQAIAVPQGTYWHAVDNSTNLASVNTGFDSSWRTFDLYLVFELGDETAAVDFGISGGNIGLSTDGVFYNGAPMSTDSVHANITGAALNPDLEFDSAVTINGNPITFTQAMDWDPAGVTGAWFVNPQQPSTGGPNGPFDMWVARITVNAGATSLGGEIFAVGTGPNGDFGGPCYGTGTIEDCIFQIPTIDPSTYVPAPGSVMIAAMAFLTGAQRRTTATDSV